MSYLIYMELWKEGQEGLLAKGMKGDLYCQTKEVELIWRQLGATESF